MAGMFRTRGAPVYNIERAAVRLVPAVGEALAEPQGGTKGRAMVQIDVTFPDAGAPRAHVTLA